MARPRGRRCPTRHRTIWIIAGGAWLWCWCCGAIRANNANKDEVWIYPTGVGGANPAFAEMDRVERLKARQQERTATHE